MFKNIKEIVEMARNTPALRLAVAAAGDESVLRSIMEAESLGIVEPILIGNSDRIEKTLAKIDYNFKGRIVSTASETESAHTALQMIKEGKADLPMKGLLGTKSILKAFLADKYGLRGSSLLSLVTLIYLKGEERLVFLTDGGMNIAPTLTEKAEIISNAVEVAQVLGISKPRVAVLAAVEKVNPAMPATLEAAILSKMADRGQIKGAIVDGPLAFDNAISMESVRNKGIESPVAGKADILIVPDIESGNVLYKSLIVYGKDEAASLVTGGKIPLVLTSRADRPEVKLNSICLTKVFSYLRKEKQKEE